MRLQGFIGPTYQDLSKPADAQDAINLYPEKIESATGKNLMVLQATPGKRVYCTLGDSPHRGAFSQDGRDFRVAGATLYEIQANGTAVNRGAVVADDNPVAFASNGAGANQLFLVSGGVGYIYDLNLNTLTRIGSAFPANAHGAAYLDGYFLTCAGVAVYASNLEDGLTWNGASKAQRNIASDNLQTILVDDHKILWLVGSQTSEPWFDNSLSPFAFTPVPSAFLNTGTGAPFSLTRFDNSIIGISQTRDGDRIAFSVGNGYTAQRLSTHAIETAWAGYARVDDAIAQTYIDAGHVFALFHFPSANATWCYDAASQLWHKRLWWNPTTGQYDADRGLYHAFSFGKHLVGARNSGVLYDQSLNYYDDAGTPRRWLRRAPHFSDENKWLYESRFELAMETGVGLSTGQGSDPKVVYRYSDDGGRTYGATREKSFGAQGQYGARVEWFRNGRFRDRVREVSGSEPVKTCLIDAYVDIEGAA